jgi:hypothetical protein
MTNRVLTGMAAVAATASLLFGGGAAMADEVGPAPAPPSGAVPSPQQPAAPDWVAVPVGPAAPSGTPADSGGVTPAPAGGATANVLQVNPIDTCVSCTSANAGPGSASARATAIRLLGNNLSGGESSSSGKNSGALLAVPASPLLSLAIADWEAATAAGSSSTSHSRAALVDLAIGPTGTSGHSGGAPAGAITVAVLEATSDAGYQGLSSNGSGANNGVHVNVGNGALVVILLHSDASSANTGSAYVIGINGNKLITSEQTGGSGVPIAVPGVIGLILLQVNANGGGGAAASVGNVHDLLGQSGQAAGVLAASAVGLTGQQAVPNSGIPSTGTASGPGGIHPPSTGVALGISGLVLVPLGLVILFASLRRRRRAPG